MISSFGDKRTAQIWAGQYVTSLDRDLQRSALRKMEMLHAASYLNDLRVPPDNRLEQLKGDRNGQYSIRINAQWRLCFGWKNGTVTGVELVDYH